MEEKNKTYTAADFARYHAGTMPAGEMHALEKAALEDPFLEDALEGYVHTSAVESDIEELKSRLAEKRKKQNVFLISSLAQNKWWRIAALFIVIAGAGYVFYQVNYIKKENSFAKNEVKVFVEKKDSTATVKADSVATKNNIAFENLQPSKPIEKEKAAVSVVKPRIKKETTPVYKTEPAIAQNSLNKSKDSFYADRSYIEEANKENNAQLAKEYLLKGKVTNEKGNALPYASVIDKAHNRGTVTDTAGFFFLQSHDSSITAMASAPGYESKSFKLKKDAQPTIAMDKTGTELSEVVVTGYGQSKKLKESKVLNGKVAGVQVTPTGPQPSGGKEKFDQYLKQNTTPVYDENNKLLTGEVLLSFKINKKGRPKNIKVVKSSCEACEKEAIQLLEKGPGWAGAKNATGTVVIKF